MRKYLIATLCIAAAVASAVSCSRGGEKKTKEVDEAWISKTLSEMTLEEKVAMIHAQSKFSSPGVPRLGIPEVWCDDGPHGVRPETLWDAWASANWTNDSCTAFPALTCLAATWDRELASLYGKSVGEEARYRGKTVLLGPGVNILRTPLNGRNFEYMGEDPYLASQMVAPYVQGVQSNGVSACVKHFALNNQEHKRHKTNVIIDDRTLYEIYLPAFKAAVVDGGVWSVMGAYNLIAGDWCCENARLLKDILKGEWGFDGVLMTDWGAVKSTEKCASNGLDIEYGTHTNGLDEGMKNAYDAYCMAQPYLNKLRTGELPESDLNDKVSRILRLELRTNMDRNRPFGRFTCPDHYAAARRIGSEGIVLLKNDNARLPIKADAKKIVVLGENAIKPFTPGGGSSSLKVQHEVNIFDGIKAAFPNTEVVFERAYVGQPKHGSKTYNYGQYDLSDPRTPEQLSADAVAAVADADYVVFVGGLNKSKKQDAEGADRESMDLPYGQDAVIEAVAAVRPDMIYVNVSGNPVGMPWADKVDAILQDWYLGSEAGNSLADVLSGAVCPSGKLPFTIPVALEDGPIKSEEQYPGIEGEDGIWQESYSEGVFVGYRWFQSKGVKPRFPFGYGLSYTTFEYGQASASSKRMGSSITVSVPVKNTGSVAGAEVVQLYIHDAESSVERPEQELKGFEKVWLAPGESKTVKFTFDRSALSFFDAASHSWVAEKGEYEARIGASSEDIRSTVSFTL